MLSSVLRPMLLSAVADDFTNAAFDEVLLLAAHRALLASNVRGDHVLRLLAHDDGILERQS